MLFSVQLRRFRAILHFAFELLFANSYYYRNSKMILRAIDRDSLPRIPFHLLVLLMVTGFTIKSAICQDCKPSKPHIDKDSINCPSGQEEIYMERVSSGKFWKLCCVEGSEEGKLQKEKALNCQATKCLSSSTENLCTTLDARYINNTMIEYEEVMRDTCVIKHHHKHEGSVGLCCRKDEEESLLLSTYGAEPHEFPHMAKITVTGECAGTVYNKRFIITAAHCVLDGETGEIGDFSETVVFLGTNIGEMDVEAEDHMYSVKNAVPHEKYSRRAGQPEFGKGVQGALYNDIALLELDRDIKFSDRIKSLEVAPNGFDAYKWSDQAVVVGWGTTNTLAMSLHLQRVNFLLRTDEACFNDDSGPWSPLRNNSDKVICVGGIMEKQWSPITGEGDSGGPAICRNKNGQPVLCGVVSGGGDFFACAKEQIEDNCVPSLFTEVQHFQDWIKKNAGEQDPSTFYQPYLYGQQVSKGKYNHQVHITSTTGKSCGGTLVAPDVVVTAAQCVMRSDGRGKEHSDLKVFTGVNDLTNDKGKMYSVKGVASLPGFKRKGKPINVAKQGDHVRITDNYYTNDLAVVKLTEKVDISESDLPRLPENDESFFEGVEVALPRNTTRSGQTLSREYKMLQLNDCQRRMDRMAKAKLNIKVDNNVICGVEKYSGGSTCDRELGGGLLCTGKNNEVVLCGVQIFRLCEYSIPNGFINMALYQDWVKTSMDKIA